MLTGEEGKTSRAFVANWAEGPRLLSLLENPSPESVVVTDSEGNQIEFNYDEIQDAIIAIVRDQVTLVLPERGRSVWPTKIVKIESN
jgi:hypothetical protein